MRKRVCRVLAACAWVLLIGSASVTEVAAAQDTTIQVVDQSGSRVRGVDVEIVDTRSGLVVRSATSDKIGRARITNLRPNVRYQAQTADGLHVSGAFKRGSKVTLRIRSSLVGSENIGLYSIHDDPEKSTPDDTDRTWWDGRETSLGLAVGLGGYPGSQDASRRNLLDPDGFVGTVTSESSPVVTLAVDLRIAVPLMRTKSGSDRHRIFFEIGGQFYPNAVDEGFPSEFTIKQEVPGWMTGLGYSYAWQAQSRTFFVEPALRVVGVRYELDVLLPVGAKSDDGMTVSVVPSVDVRTPLAKIGRFDLSVSVGVFAAIPVSGKLSGRGRFAAGEGLHLFSFDPKTTLGVNFGTRVAY